MIGTVLDKYEVLQKVGEGGMATVYLGRHSTLDRPVAIKVLHPHLSSSTRNRKRFAREARAIEHLRHENILEIFDYSGNDSQDCYIVTEFVDGQTLTDLMETVGVMPSEAAAIVGVHLSQALAYAHDHGVLHRDLKPDNVMLRGEGTIKLMDFGIARFLDESQVTMTGALVGSPAFMSPEQAREDTLDQRSDLFSLGTLLFFLVTGLLPFTGGNPSLILKNIIEGQRPSVAELAPTVSASLADVIERLLQVDRDERFPTAHSVREALEASLAETAVDPDDPQWCMSRYADDPESYGRRLEHHLSRVLLERGKQFLDDGDHLAALRLFNRLLAMDEDNEQVLALVQGLHIRDPADTEPRLRPLAWLALLGGSVALAFALVSAASSRDEAKNTIVIPEPPPPAPIERVVQPVVESPPPPQPSSEMPLEPATVAAPAPARPARALPKPRAAIATATPAPAAALAVVDEPVRVQLRTGRFPAEIWEDGRMIGNTRQPEPLTVSRGTHRFILKHPLHKDLAVEVDLVNDLEKRVLLEPLEALPMRVSTEYPPTCVAVLDGARLGTLGELGWAFDIPGLTEMHRVLVDCGAGPPHTQVLSNLLMGPAQLTFQPDP